MIRYVCPKCSKTYAAQPKVCSCNKIDFNKITTQYFRVVLSPYDAQTIEQEMYNWDSAVCQQIEQLSAPQFKRQKQRSYDNLNSCTHFLMEETEHGGMETDMYFQYRFYGIG